MGELACLIYQSLLHFESQEFSNLAQILASESIMQFKRLWAIVESPLKMEKLIGYLANLSTEQMSLLVGGVTLRLLRKISSFMEDKGTLHTFPQKRMVSENKARGNRYAKSNCEWNEATPVSGYRVWRDTDAALVLLLISESQEQDCLEAAKKWQVDPMLYRNFVATDNIKLSQRSTLLRNYLSENFQKMAYDVPGLLSDVSVETAGLRSYVDLIDRHLRLLMALMSESECLSVKQNTCPPASGATILTIPAGVYRGEGKQCSVCSICGDDLEGGSLASCLPCSHVYHWECIHPWLKTRNTCPVCRHELPTDNVFYEIGRHIKCLMQRNLS